MSKMNEFVGEVPLSITGCESGSEEICFVMGSGKVIRMVHHQDCCESVSVEEVIGCEPQDLIGYEILSASEDSNCDTAKYGNVQEWTFYTLRSHGGTMTIRWCGTSNGYYSTSVSIEVMNPAAN